MTGPTDPTGATGPIDEQRDQPPLRLVRGDATAEEVAALLAVLSAASGGGDEAPAPRHTSQWAAPQRAVRRPLTPGRGAWRSSAWPR